MLMSFPESMTKPQTLAEWAVALGETAVLVAAVMVLVGLFVWGLTWLERRS